MGRLGQVVVFALLLAGGSACLAQEKPGTAEKKPLSPEAFLELRLVQDPQFSPDGTKVAFVVSDPWKGEKRTRHIWMYDRGSNTTRQFTYSEKSETSPRWSPDGTKLAILSNRGEHQQIYVLRMSGGEAAALSRGKRDVDSFAWSPDGKQIAFLAKNPKTDEEEKKEKEKDDAHIVDKDDKRTRLWLLDPVKQEERALTPANWNVNEFVWLPTAGQLVMIASEHPESSQITERIYRVEAGDGTARQLAAPRSFLSSLRASPQGNTVSYVSSHEGGPTEHDLMLLSAEGGAPRNLTGASLDRKILDSHWAKDGAIVAVYAEGFRNRFVGYNSEGEKKVFPELPVNPGQFAIAPTGEIAFTGEAATAPQELWLRGANGEAQQVSHVNEAWKQFALVAPEFYRFKSFDGLEIEAALLKPAGYDGKSKLPAIALVHGGPAGRWTDSIEAWSQLLAARGYAVFMPNVRGSSSYGETFVESNRGDWGGGDYRDVMAGVDDLIAKGIADSDRLGIGGWSYGGYMAEWAVTQTTRFKAAVSGAGMANLISEYGTEEGPQGDEWYFGVPYEKPEGFLNSSPFLYVKNAKTPTLILQGEADKVDPLGQSQELYRGLMRYGVVTELVVYPREPHGFQEAKHRLDMQKRMLEWFATYLK